MQKSSIDLPEEQPEDVEIRRSSVGPIWQEQRAKGWYWVAAFIVAVLLGISLLS